MRVQILVGVFLAVLTVGVFSMPVTASAQEEPLASCPATQGVDPAISLVAYGSVSGGRLYLKKIEVKVGDVTLTPPLTQGIEFGYLDDSDNTAIRTQPITPRGSVAPFTSDKISALVQQRSKGVQQWVNDLLKTNLSSFSIEAHPAWGYQVSVSGEMPIRKAPGTMEDVDLSFPKCVVSQSAKDALDSALLARSKTKTGSSKITMTASASAR